MSFFPGSTLFRERALSRGDMRESLDQRVRVVSVPRWVALALGILVVCGFVAWAASSEIETAVSGTGVLSSAPPLAVVESAAAGVVAEIVSEGQAVRSGERIARVRTSDGRMVNVTSYASGAVASVRVQPGEVVAAGDPLVSIEPEGGNRAAYLFVPLDDVSQIEVGQEVLLSAEVQESQATQLVKGVVDHVGTAPATPEELERKLGPALGPRLASGPLLVEVGVRVVGSGPVPGGQDASPSAPEALPVGTLLSGRVVVSRRSPLDYVF